MISTAQFLGRSLHGRIGASDKTHPANPYAYFRPDHTPSSNLLLYCFSNMLVF